MGQILDCGDSETRKGEEDDSKNTKIVEYDDNNDTSHIPVDVLDTRRDMWRWVVGYKKGASHDGHIRIELAKDGSFVNVPVERVQEPYQDLAHTCQYDAQRFGELLGIDMEDCSNQTTSPLHIFLDILDVYEDSKGREISKWRKAEIIKHNKYCTWIKVHYLGWESKYDQKINLLRDFDRRVRKFGSMTDVRTEEGEDGNPLSSHETRFKQQLRENVRGVMRVYLCGGDGNCLFRAVAHQVWADQDRHEEMRSLCCDYMSLYNIGRALYDEKDDDGYQKYLIDKRRNGVWGDDPEIRAMEEMLDVRIEIWNSSLEEGGGIDPSTIHFSGSLPPSAVLQSAPVVRISLHGNNHYNSIIMETIPPPLLSMFQKCTTQTIRKWREDADRASLEVVVDDDDEEEEEEEEEGVEVVEERVF